MRHNIISLILFIVFVLSIGPSAIEEKLSDTDLDFSRRKIRNFEFEILEVA